jgi:hypothetical protein
MQTSQCEHCKKACVNEWHGGYDFGCVECCARLVISARPNKRLQESMLAAISGYAKSPSRGSIIDCIKNKQIDTAKL